MNKKTIIALVVAIVVIAAAVFYFSSKKNEQVKTAAPAVNVGTNPLEKAPDLNPVDQANPFNNIKTNPFQ